jgi:hypothetical protein
MTFGFTNASDVPLALWGSEIQNKAPSIGYRQVMDSEAGVAQLTMNIVSGPPLSSHAMVKV